jgi:hypothetical protein
MQLILGHQCACAEEHTAWQEGGGGGGGLIYRSYTHQFPSPSFFALDLHLDLPRYVGACPALNQHSELSS